MVTSSGGRAGEGTFTMWCARRPRPAISSTTSSPSWSQRFSTTLEPFSSSKQPVPTVPLPITSPAETMMP